MSATAEREAQEPGAEATRLFEAHSTWLRRYCVRQLGSPADADDAVQTTFLYALRALKRDVVPECEEAWLTAIAKNVCYTHRRTLGRRGTLTGDVDLDTIALAAAEDDDGDRELLMGLKAALATLPENQRRALVLREWHGVPSREIASQLRLSAPATHALLCRARRSLARALTVPRPLAGFDLGGLLYRLETVLRALTGGAAKVTAVAAAATVVAAGVAPEPDGARAGRSAAVGAREVAPTTHSPSLVRSRAATKPRQAGRSLVAPLSANDTSSGHAARFTPSAPGAEAATPSAPVTPTEPAAPPPDDGPVPPDPPRAPVPPSALPPPLEPPPTGIEPPGGLLPPLPPLPVDPGSASDPLPPLPLQLPTAPGAGLPLP